MIDLREPAFRADPHTYLAQKLAEAPAHADPMGIVHVLGHPEVSQLIKDPRLGKDLRRWQGYAMVRPYGAGTTFERYVEQWMLSREAPDHGRLRRLALQGFTPRAVAAMRTLVAETADALIGALPDRGTVELMTSFAQPFPVQVICRILGFPAEDYAQLKEWSDGVALAVEPLPKKYPQAEACAVKMVGYAHARIEERRRRPGDDLLTALVEARDGGDRLSEDELVAMVLLLFVAAHETTTNVIGNGLLALLGDPAAFTLLRAEPALLSTAVEELMRFDPPAIISGRAVHEPIEVAGLSVPAGGIVFLNLGAANRDPRTFSAPDRLDLRRQPNPHLSFGGGIHYCLGAPLARLEGQIAFDRLLRRWPRIEPGGQAVWRRRVNLRGLESLPLRVG